MYKKQIEKAIKIGDIFGWTTTLKGKQARYIVGLTNYTKLDIDLLNITATIFMYQFDNINVGGWTDKKGVHFVDISTSTDDLNFALNLASYYKQQAIYDTKEAKEIYINNK